MTSLYIRETRIKPKAVVPKVVNVFPKLIKMFLGMWAGVLAGTFACIRVGNTKGLTKPKHLLRCRVRAAGTAKLL
jgi:hypothetical protein